MLDLKGKQILFFSPKAFGYEEAIKMRLEDYGANVVYYDDRPSNGFWGKAVLRAKPQLMKWHVEKYYRKIFKEVISMGTSEYIFLLNLEAMPLWFLKKVKEANPKATIVFYMWDSLKNKPHAAQYMVYCNKTFSFDPHDESANGFRFRPLFYINEYAGIAKKKDYVYDLSFIGTAHSDRLRISEQLERIIEKNGGCSYKYLYLQSKKLWFYLKMHDPNFKKTHSSDFNYTSLSTQATIDVISKSRIVLDIQHPRQTGLTMRAIEMIGAERKLITTNAAIKDYDFYSPQNIYVIDREKPFVDKDFLDSKYEPISSELYHKYSIDGWLEELFT